MIPYDDIALPLGTRSQISFEHRLAQRIQMVLETQPGTLPFSPGFGCDLNGLVGGTAAQSRLSEARMRITAALSRWVPGVQLKTCEVKLVDTVNVRGRHPSVPIAEAALASHALSSVLEVRIVVETEAGELEMTAVMNP